MTMTMDRRSTAVAEPPSRPSRRATLLGAAAIALSAVGSVLALVPAAPLSADAPATDFSAARAMVHVEQLSGAPRTMGSAAHAEAQQYVVETLSELGWQVEVHRAVGFTDWGGGGTHALAEVANVVATLPGSAPTGTVLLAAHYDTVAGSPGAGDDGAGVAAVLEVARAIESTPERPLNDVVVLLSDGEEMGLVGAEAFVRDRAQDLGHTVVLNHEARGNSGTPMTFRMTSPNGALLDALSTVPGVFADSSTQATFAALPNDSDFTHFSDGGMHGFDTALAGGGAYYHSPLDVAANLSPASLQQLGQGSLALARTLTDADLATLDDGVEQQVTTMPWGLLCYPAGLELPLAVGTLLVTGALLVLARRRRVVTLPRAALGAVTAGVTLAAAGAAGLAVWQLALTVDPGQASAVTGDPYRPLAFKVAILLAAVAVVVALLRPLRRRLGAAALALGSLVLLAVAGVLLAVALPGTSMVIVLPVLAVAVTAGLAAVLPWPPARLVAMVAGLAAATVLVVPGVWVGFDAGLGLGGPASAVFLALLLLLALPTLDVVRPVGPAPRRRAWRALAAPALVLVLAASAGAIGVVLNREGATPPRQESVSYLLDADTDEARWLSSTPRRSGWSRSLLPAGPEPVVDVAPWTDGRELAHGPAPVGRGLAGPEVEVLEDHVRGELRDLTLRISSRRGAPTVGVWVDAGTATVREATVAGRSVPVRAAEGPWDFGALLTGSTSDGVTVRLVLEQHGDHVTVRVADRSDDLRGAPELDVPTDRVLVTPHLHVTRQQEL